MKEVRIFHSKYTWGSQKVSWERIISKLRSLNYSVEEEIKNHDKAIVLGGFWENPNAFKNPVVFYLKKLSAVVYTDVVYDYLSTILPAYYDNMIDLSGLSTDKAAEKIIDEIN